VLQLSCVSDARPSTVSRGNRIDTRLTRQYTIGLENTAYRCIREAGYMDEGEWGGVRGVRVSVTIGSEGVMNPPTFFPI